MDTGADNIRADDERYMFEALEQARIAALVGEVPIGAVVVCDGAVVARGHNRREIDADPTAHAEMLAVREAAGVVGRWRVSGWTGCGGGSGPGSLERKRGAGRAGRGHRAGLPGGCGAAA